MPQIEVILPKMGESVAEATIIKWVVNEGDTIEADDPLVEIATDKVDSEVPAPEDGVLVKRLCEEGDVVEVGKPIAIIDTGGEGESPAPDQKSTEKKETAEPATASTAAKTESPRPAPVAEEAITGLIPRTGDSGRFYSPLVRNIAKEEGIGVAELEKVEGTGKDGRVTKKDILSYRPERDANGSAAEAAPAAPAAAAEAAPQAAKAPAAKPTVLKPGPDDEIIEMDRMRRMISDHMSHSKHTSAHVTSYVEADMTNIVTWRNKWKNKFQEREGEKLTFTPIFIEAIVRAIKELPMVNVSTDGERILKRKHINIGMATALPSGNLIVPVIHDADQLNLVGLAKKVNDLAKRARENKLKPEEIQGGTYTVTNVGTFGNVMGTPIINQPQTAVMAVGAIRKKPAVIETPEGDFIGIRQLMFLSHSYDHRVIDGALGGKFVRLVGDILEQFDVNREI
ncbi:MAG: dihydrolipoamide acetyltransferase family protein [Cryomorphaceae bacterium]